MNTFPTSRVPAIAVVLALIVVSVVVAIPAPAFGQTIVEIQNSTPAPDTPPDVLASSAPGIAYETNGTNLQARFPDDARQPVIIGGPWSEPISIRTTGIQFRDASGNVLHSDAPAESIARRTATHTVSYDNVWPGMTDEFTVMPTRVKHDLVLDRMPSMGVNVEWFGASYEMVLPAGLRLLDRAGPTDRIARGDLVVVDGEGNMLYYLEPVVAVDAADNTFTGRYRVRVENGVYIVVMEVEAADLRTAAFPVRIDPTVTVSLGTISNAIPFDPGFNDPQGAMQTLYTAAQIGQGGTIVRMWVQMGDAATSFNYQDIEVLMGETTLDANSFSTTYANNYDAVAAKTVYRGQWNLTSVSAGDWEEIQLDDTFDYSGTNNLVVEFRVYSTPIGVGRVGLYRGNNAANSRVYTWSAVIGPTGTKSTGIGYNIRIEFPDALTIFSPVPGALFTGEVGVPYSETFQAADGIPGYTWAISSVPPGMSFNTATGVLSGTPTTTGSYSFDVTVTDTNNDTDVVAYTWDVVDELLISTPAAGALPGGPPNVAYGPVTFTATGGTTPYTWRVSSGSLPPGLSLNSSTGELSGTPTTIGNYSFTIMVEDPDILVDTRDYTLAISDSVLIDSPAAGAMVEGYLTDNYSVTVTASGGTQPYAWTFTGTLPDGLGLNGSTGEISGVPTTAGTFNFTIQVEDANNATDTRDYSITVVTLPTISSPAPGALSEGTANAPTSYGLPAVDFESQDGVTPHTWSAPGLPGGLSINASTGVISGTPTAAGTTNFDVTVTDANGKQHTQSYSITINAAVAISTSSLPDASETSAYSTTITSTGGTATYTWAAVFTPTVADFAINSSTGEITGNPAIGDGGTYDVQITITDQYGSTDMVTLTLTITQPAASIGGAGGGCSCTTNPTPGQSREQTLQMIAFVLLVMTLALIRRRLA